MIEILDDNNTIVKTLSQIDNNLISIIKHSDLSQKYNIDFKTIPEIYLDELFNKHFSKNKISLSILSTKQPQFNYLLIDQLTDIQTILPSITRDNLIDKMYFVNENLFIKPFNESILYKIRIIPL